MANHNISKDNFNLELRKLQTNDKAHADTFNPLFETLINNDATLKDGFGEIEDKLTDLGSKQTNLGKKQGNLSTLKTTNKDNIVGALNELFTNANNGKKLISDVVGSPLLATDSFKQQSSKIQSLKNTFASNLSGKGQNSSSTESLDGLVDKIKNISTGKKFLKGKIYISELMALCDEDYTTDKDFLKQIYAPFEIGFVFMDLYPPYIFIQKGFIDSDIRLYDSTTYSRSPGWTDVDCNDYMEFDYGHTKVEGSVIHLNWHIKYLKRTSHYIPENCSFNWIAVEK